MHVNNAHAATCQAHSELKEQHIVAQAHLIDNTSRIVQLCRGDICE